MTWQAEAPVVTRPDVEALVWQTIKGITPGGKGINSWAYTAVPLPSPLGWLVSTSIQVDTRASGKQAALARANEARQLIFALSGSAWDEGVVTAVELIEEAFWNPDVDGGPRYTARYAVVTHP